VWLSLDIALPQHNPYPSSGSVNVRPISRDREVKTLCEDFWLNGNVVRGFSAERQGHNVAMTASYVPDSLESGIGMTSCEMCPGDVRRGEGNFVGPSSAGHLFSQHCIPLTHEWA